MSNTMDKNIKKYNMSIINDKFDYSITFVYDNR